MAGVAVGLLAGLAGGIAAAQSAGIRAGMSSELGAGLGTGMGKGTGAETGARLGAGTGAAQAMGQRLRQIFAANDWKADPNKTGERVIYYQRLLKQPLRLPDRVSVALELANEQLRTGDSTGSVATLEELEKQLAGASVPEAVWVRLHRELAIAWLRVGEQQNCVSNHTALSCVYPLRGSAVHRLQTGATHAVDEYTWLLQHEPDSWLYRWLLNVAYQQLGRYPQDVPKAWLIPESLSDSEYGIGYFPNVAMLAGIGDMDLSGGAVVEDFDGDGQMDILVSSSGPLDRMHFYHNNGDGTFTDRTHAAGLDGELGGLDLVLTDYNNDGRPDVLVIRGEWWGRFGHYPMSLLRNNGDGTFTDVTRAAGLWSERPTSSAAWADYDGDGRLDLFVTRESQPGDRNPSVLYHNNGDGTFTKVEGAIPGELGFAKGAAWGDYNRDGRPDLYVSAMRGQSWLFRNDGPADPLHPDPLHWRFTDVTDAAGLGGERNTFATWFFDYDNDGWPDLFAAGYSTESMEDVGRFEAGQPHHASLPRLFHNNGDGTFTDVAHAVGLDRAILTMGAGFGDLDNDGWQDLYLGTGEPSYEALLPNRMFRNDAGRRFEDVTTAGGFGNLQHAHAVVFADLENDGQEDVFEEMGGAYPGDRYFDALYRNPGHGNHWITLVLKGVKSNRPGYGATIEVRFREPARDAGRKAEQTRTVWRTVGSVSSFGSAPFRQHIGVGRATRIDEVVVHWPASGMTDRIRDVAVDRNYRLREGSGRLVPVTWKRYEFGKSRIAGMTGMGAMSAKP